MQSGKSPTEKVAAGITIDFSFALLHAALLAFNRESVGLYMQRSWKVMNKQEEWPDDKMFITMCVAHLLHSFSSNIKGKGVPKPVRELALYSLAKLQQVTTLEDFEHVVEGILKLFGSKKFHQKIWLH